MGYNFFRLSFFMVLLLLPLVHNGQNNNIGSIDTAILIKTPMTPPMWALLERELLDSNTAACRKFFDKYFDERGFLLAVERWGANDGPDDAIENVANWPILHALGGSDEILHLYKKAWEGHLQQYTAAKTIEVPFARAGMYYKEFPVMMDWMHNGEGLRVFDLQGLSDPYDIDYQKRVRRFAGFYLNEDPESQNYDPKHKIIKSLFNGSRGPLLRKATSLDWAGDPIQVKNRFKAGHGERTYAEMLEHFKDYTEIIGDHPQNMGSTSLAVNAYMLTGEKKYKDWLIEYVDAWLERMDKNGGIIPSNIGLDGKIGGATGGKWYGGTYGWGFSPIVPQTGEIEHRTRVYRGFVGFSNAFLLTGDFKYIKAWGNMLDKINSNKKNINGKVQYPHMYGDDGWYAYRERPVQWSTLECYFFTLAEQERNRLKNNGWIEFLEGKNSDYPEQVLRTDLSRIREKHAAMLEDTTTPDTRLADNPMKFNPVSIGSLLQLMMAGLDPGRGGGPLHSRLRYFDPLKNRAGIPLDVAALIDEMKEDYIAVSLVNLNQIESRELILQAGSYAEHQITKIVIDEQQISVNKPYLKLELLPGAGNRILIYTKRHVNQPTLIFPWDYYTQLKINKN